MPAMFRHPTINPEEYPIEVAIQSLEIQVELTRNLFLDNWSRLKGYIPQIAAQYFDGESSIAVEYVILPLLISAYHTGYSNVKKLLDGFLRKYPDQASIKSAYSLEYTGSMGSDVYYYMTQFGRNTAEIRTYKKESALYYYKTLAISRALLGMGTVAKIQDSPLTETNSKTRTGIGMIL